MLGWDREFHFSNEQKARIRELLPNNAAASENFLFKAEIAAQTYRGIARDWYEGCGELKPHQFRPILLRISRTSEKLMNDLNALGVLSGLCMIEGAISQSDPDRHTPLNLRRLAHDLKLLVDGARCAYESSEGLGPMVPEKFLARTIKWTYRDEVGPPGSSRNCNCYKIVGLILNFAGKYIDDWYHHYREP